MKIFLFLFILSVGAESFAVSGLCRFLVGRISDAAFYDPLVLSAEAFEADHLERIVVREVMRLTRGYLRNRYSEITGETPYDELLITPLKQSQTIFEYVSQKDVPVVIDLPGPFESTLFDHLTPTGRHLFAVRLARLMRKGNYDLAMHEQKVLTKLIVQAKAFLTDVGMDPAAWLVKAARRGNAGVCRHANVAIFALLVELGYPADRIRLVSGAKEDGEGRRRHLWIEYLDDNGIWHEIDGTPRSNAAPRVRDGNELHPSDDGAPRRRRQHYGLDHKEFYFTSP